MSSSFRSASERLRFLEPDFTNHHNTPNATIANMIHQNQELDLEPELVGAAGGAGGALYPVFRLDLWLLGGVLELGWVGNPRFAALPVVDALR